MGVSRRPTCPQAIPVLEYFRNDREMALATDFPTDELICACIPRQIGDGGADAQGCAAPPAVAGYLVVDDLRVPLPRSAPAVGVSRFLHRSPEGIGSLGIRPLTVTGDVQRERIRRGILMVEIRLGGMRTLMRSSVPGVRTPGNFLPGGTEGAALPGFRVPANAKKR